MAAEIGVVVGHHYEVALAGLDVTLAARARVALPGGMGLDRRDGLGSHRRPYRARIAHNVSPIAAASVATTRTTSATFGVCRRKGLKPMRGW